MRQSNAVQIVSNAGDRALKTVGLKQCASNGVKQFSGYNAAELGEVRGDMMEQGGFLDRLLKSTDVMHFLQTLPSGSNLL